MTRNPKTIKASAFVLLLPWFLFASLLVLSDQICKWWIASQYAGRVVWISTWLEWRTMRNPGFVLGWGDPHPGGTSNLMALLVTLFGMVVLLWVAARCGPHGRMRRAAFACMMGGAAGNGLDRLWRGYVLDFVQIPFLPVFNLADVWVLLGMALFCFSLAEKKSGKRYAPDTF